MFSLLLLPLSAFSSFFFFCCFGLFLVAFPSPFPLPLLSVAIFSLLSCPWVWLQVDPHLRIPERELCQSHALQQLCLNDNLTWSDLHILEDTSGLTLVTEELLSRASKKVPFLPPLLLL